MKKLLMAIVLCLVCTVSFGQESKYVKTTSVDIIESGVDFIIARKLNGKNITVFNCDTIPNQGMFLKMDSDSTVFCNDSLSMCFLGSSIIRNKDYKYLTSTNDNKGLYFSDTYNVSYVYLNYLSGNNYFCIYNSKFPDSYGYGSYLYLKYDTGNNIFKCSEFSSNCGYPTYGGNFTLEIYVKQAEDSPTTDINNITVKQNTIKCIKNGKLTIQKDGKTYDILGNQIY
jgi:hypothetical protein